ncbi:MAG: hypothetical protein HDR88_05065 [Bacteroides sp.]|nr:hypothetical protein [Bacteroides sp.]
MIEALTVKQDTDVTTDRMKKEIMCIIEGRDLRKLITIIGMKKTMGINEMMLTHPKRILY